MTGDSSRSGTRLGPYLIGKLLGRGGMGEVYEAYDTVKDRTVALKLLPPHYLHNDDFRDRFERESRTAARLSDPHIIPIHDFGDIDGLLFIDMRLVDGRDLRSVLADGPLPPVRAVAILSQIAGALDSAHRSGLVHRDVKPDNILVDGEDFAYLVDFGIAHGQTDTRLTMVGTALGSLAYMAPERFGDEPAGPAADVYALACVLYEAVAGTPPFPAKTDQGLMSAHLTKPPPVLGGPLDPVIATGMAKEPAQRYGSAKEMMRAATAALSAPQRSAPAPVAAPRSPYPAPQAPTSGPHGGAVPGRPQPAPFGSGPHGSGRRDSGPGGSGPSVIGPVGGGAVSGPTAARAYSPTQSGPTSANLGHSGPATPSGPTRWGLASGPTQHGSTSGPQDPPTAGGGFGPPPAVPQNFVGGGSWGGPGGSGPQRPPQRSNRGRMIALGSVAAAVVVVVAVVAILISTSGGSGSDPVAPTSDTTAVAGTACTYRTASASGPPAPKPDAQQPNTGNVQAAFDTTLGDIALKLDPSIAPCNVGAIVSLIRSGYYDNSTCHRVGSNFLTCGDLTGSQNKNASNPGWSSPDEFPTSLPRVGVSDPSGRPVVTYPRGAIVMLNVDPKERSDPSETFASGAFFMLTAPSNAAAINTMVGSVTPASLTVLDKIVQAGFIPAKPGEPFGRPQTPVIITAATVTP